MKIKWTMDEIGEDYTEMMCISCGEYIGKDLMVCPFCVHHYHVISKRTYHKQLPTPRLTESYSLVLSLETNGQAS